MILYTSIHARLSEKIEHTGSGTNTAAQQAGEMTLINRHQQAFSASEIGGSSCPTQGLLDSGIENRIRALSRIVFQLVGVGKRGDDLGSNFLHQVIIVNQMHHQPKKHIPGIGVESEGKEEVEGCCFFFGNL